MNHTEYVTSHDITMMVSLGYFLYSYTSSNFTYVNRNILDVIIKSRYHILRS